MKIRKKKKLCYRRRDMCPRTHYAIISLFHTTISISSPFSHILSRISFVSRPICHEERTTAWAGQRGLICEISIFFFDVFTPLVGELVLRDRCCPSEPTAVSKPLHSHRQPSSLQLTPCFLCVMTFSRVATDLID